MSTQTEITRLQTARNKLRTWLVGLGLAASTDKLDALTDKAAAIKNNGAVDAQVKEGESYTVPKGYHDGTGTVKGVGGGGNYQLQAKTVTPTKEQQAVTPDQGYYGLSGVTEVVRGHDLIGSTPRQIWLYELFGFTPPNFIHIPLLCDHDGRRLSKRDEDLDLGLLREKFTPEQVIGALACAAGLTDTAEPVAAKELVKAFSWEKIPKHELYLPNVFRDIEKN